MSEEKKKEDPKADKPAGGKTVKTESEEKAKGIVGSLLESILQPLGKFLPKKNLNIIISLLNPWLDDSAETSSRKVKQWLGEHPWLKDKKVGAALGALSAKIEDEADKYDEPTKVALKKISDWIETFTSELRKNSGEYTEETGHSTGSSTTERAKKFDAGDAKLAEDALARIASALPSQIDGIKEINRGRAGAWEEAKRDITRGIPKPEVPKEPGVPFSDQLDQFGEAVGTALTPLNDDLERGVAKLQAHNQQLRDKKLATASPSNSPGAKVLRWLFK